MKYEARQVRNNILLNLNSTGSSQKSLGKLVNLSQQWVSEILSKQAQGLPLSTKSQGAKRRLSDAQLLELPTFLSQGSEFYGFTGAYWTHKRVGYVIKKEFDVIYEDKQVGRILKSINWTWQKPQKKEAKQSAEKVEIWKNEGLPALKKKP